MTNDPNTAQGGLTLYSGWYDCNAQYNNQFYYNNETTPFPTADDAACGAGTFFANMEGNYLLGGCAFIQQFNYFTNVGIVVGAQLYDPFTLNPINNSGYFLNTGNLDYGPDIPAYLDPTNTEYQIPDDWSMIIITNGIITQIIQYNTLSCP
jgi:hypothetical protein